MPILPSSMDNWFDKTEKAFSSPAPLPSVANWTVASTSTMELDVVTAAELSSEEAFKTKDTSPTGVSRISIATPGPKARKDANTVGFRNVCKKDYR